ncbi:unnamed protein product [Spirodela intermedia]|uniref:non-specific serine/threonine protein kinase n=1 Tax=Spirodela intermedia TaxID=51605 RepID=A0A7I8JMK0_SPIIN|nr:unnamed protein product [Spirodela intermedia]CAA6671031.1 unnamed protein product [Spirodela intermedia]
MALEVPCFLLVFFLAAGVSIAFEPLNHEVVALIGIKGALSDPNGVLKNWDEDSADPANLSGSLSGAIGNLTNLQQVLLQNNNITGTIPAELGTLRKLQTLDLSNNGFSGAVPESLGQLTALHYLRLNNNSLSGPFPTSLSKIPQLSFLDVSYNNLSGPVQPFPARTFNILGNPLICGRRSTEECTKTAVPISPSPAAESSLRKTKTQKVAVAVGASLGSTSMLLLLVGLLCWRRKRRHQSILGISEKEDGGAMVMELGNLHQFGLRELQAATDNFSSRNILGKGGFGNVYKGRLADGTVVAVKRLKDVCSSGEVQFRTEVEMISLAVHRNLLRLLGYCATANERLLVYPFMPNGSVASRLRGKPALDWSTRKRIALGAARGLLYLHEQCDPKIIHRDVKAANVLLDEFCEAVVGDFGLAKLLDHGDSHVTTAVRGTVGHIAPEYLSTGQSSDKTDVFGFGILLLELLTGRNALDFAAAPTLKGGAMLDWVRRAQEEKRVELLVDRNLRSGAYDLLEVGEMVQVALLCTHYLPASRPRMSEVVRMLEGEGLAEKWAASNYKLAAPQRQNSTVRHQVFAPPGDLLLMDADEVSAAAGEEEEEDDDDRRSLDAAEMELSGPR